MTALWTLVWTIGWGVSSEPLVDRVVAVVDKQVITQSELLCEARVVLVVRQGESAADVDFDEPALRAFADYIVNQTLITAQVRRLGAADVTTADMEQEVAHFVQRFHTVDAYQAFMRRYDISQETLHNILERNLRNQRFITERMRLLVPGGSTPDPSSVQYQTGLRRWLDELRDAVDVRLWGPNGELELVPKRAPLANVRQGQ